MKLVDEVSSVVGTNGYVKHAGVDKLPKAIRKTGRLPASGGRCGIKPALSGANVSEQGVDSSSYEMDEKEALVEN